LEVKIVPEKWKGRRNVDKCLALPIPNIGIREAGGIWLTLKMNNSLTTTTKKQFLTQT
jgi:hypothetical protein